MKLIAKKPCSFGGKQFFIGDEVAAELVLNPVQQAAWGTLELVEEDPAPAPEAPAPAPVVPVTAPVEAAKPPKKAPVKKIGKKPVEEAGDQ